MPKKSHKPHRQRDKHALKTRNQHKHKKEHSSQNPLEPIQEVSKEKVKIDKNACGDFLHASLVRSQLKDDETTIRKTRHSKERCNKPEDQNNNEKSKRDNIKKDNTKGKSEKSVRHQSLEKNEDSLLTRTKLLFRKEKSFNDAVQKVSTLKDNTAENDGNKKEKKRKQLGRKPKENYAEENDKEKKKLAKDKLITEKNPSQTIIDEHSSQIPKQKRAKSRKRKHESKDKSPHSNKQLFSRVQEVIYCQTNQVPYKMKNDKNASEVKDLYRRIRKEDPRSKDRNKSAQNRSRSHDGNDLEHERTLRQSKIDREKNMERSRTENKRGSAFPENRKFNSEMYYEDMDRKEKYRNETLSPQIVDSKTPTKRNHRHNDLSEITLGPYEKYFAFDKSCHYQKHHKKEHVTKNIDKKYQNNRTVEAASCKKESQEKDDSRNKLAEVEEQKIHKIVEGDLRNYFCKIQTLIDKKLDAVLQINKSKNQERQKRSRSKTKEQSPGRNTENKKEKAEKKRLQCSEKKADQNINKEDIINEVIKRLREDERETTEDKEKGKRYNPRTKKTEVVNYMSASKDNSIPINKKYHDMSSFHKSPESKHLHTCITEPSKEKGHRESTESHNECKKGRHQHVSSRRSSKNGPTEGNKLSCKPKQFSEKLLMAKDSLECIKHRSSPPRDLIIPVEDMCSVTERDDLKIKKRHRKPQMHEDNLIYPYASVSSCKTFSEVQFSRSVISKQRNDLNLHRRAHHIYSASDETMQGKYHKENRKSSSPERYTPGRDDIVTEQQSKENRQNEALIKKKDKYVHLHKSSPKYQHNISSQDPEPLMEEIFLPPESFRHNGENSTNLEILPSPRHTFIVQGIEPPILDCTREASRKNVRARKLECKTVSIVGIPPRINVKESPMTTSSKSHKSLVANRDLVEKRKASKRFKLYYKYSTVDNAQENSDGSSDARSVVSDSYKVVSDPSEERLIQKEQHKDRRNWKSPDVCQMVSPVPKKMNRISTPRNSHLNNIIEEPSNTSIAIRNQDYFVPLRGTNEFYSRVLTSSHSDYCFKIDKKAANSNISVESRDTWDAKCIYCENEKYRCYSPDVRSRTEFKLVSRVNGRYVLRSKSDVLLNGSKRKQLSGSVFVEDCHSFARGRNVTEKPNRDSAFKKLLKEKSFLLTACKECQTTEVEENRIVRAVEGDTKTMIEVKQKQFQEIYKTIDSLEENIHTSRRAPPKTVDVAVSSMTFSFNKTSNDKKPQGKVTYKNIDNTDDIDNRGKKVNASIDSPVRSRNSERNKRSLPVKQIQDVAVGDSEVALLEKPKTPRCKSEKPQRKESKHLKSTGVSPIRITEPAVTQVLTKSPTRKAVTPRTPRIKQPVVLGSSGQSRSKQTSQNSPFRTTTPKIIERKKEQSALSQKVQLTKETLCPKSAARPRLPSKENSQMSSKDSGAQQKAAQRNKISRSEERSTKPQSSGSQMTKLEPNAEENMSNVVTCSVASQPEKCTSEVILEEDELMKNTVSKPTQDVIKDSCLPQHAQKKSRIAVAKKSTSPSTNTKTVIVNTATLKGQPSVQVKIVATESSTSSTLSDVPPQNIRRSKSLVEIRSHKADLSRSKSDICCLQTAMVVDKDCRLNTNEPSMASNNMEKFTNRPNIGCAKSHGTSLDQYIENKFSSRLFLTKDFKGAAVSSYQKRKLYDQSIRQKMKKHFRLAKMEVCPQIFEVRFLSMINQVKNQAKEKPIKTINLGRVMEESSTNRKECYSEPNNSVNTSKTLDANDATNRMNINSPETLQVKERDLIFDHFRDIVIDVKTNSSVDANIEVEHRVTDKISTTSEENAIKQIFPRVSKDAEQEKLMHFCKKFLDINNIFDEEMLKNASCTCSKFSSDCSACKNFVNIMDTLYASLTNYQEARNNLANYVSNSSELECKEQVVKTLDATDKLDPKITNPQKENPEVEEIFSASYNKNSSDSNQSTAPFADTFNEPVECISLETVEKYSSPILSQPISCPILVTNSSSFEFLYEETSSENEIISRDAILANLTKPFDQNFNFSSSQYNVEAPFVRLNNYESAAGSIESGYASIKSKNCTNSLTNFFKKPNIVALFKPPVLAIKKGKQCGPENFDKKMMYKEMTRRCQLYAKKVRQRSEMKLEENVDEYQEFSLQFLLGQTGSVMLESKAMTLRSIDSDLEARNQDLEQLVRETELGSARTEDQCYELSSTASSQDSFKANEVSHYQNGCKLILSNAVLKIESVTYLGPDIFKDDIDKRVSISKSFCNKNLGNYGALPEQESLFTFDFSLDSNNPFVSNNDSTTQKFFTSLIKIYEKELEICNKLYNEDLFEQELLSAVKNYKIEKKKNKKRRFCGFFKAKSARKEKSVERAEYEKEVDLQECASTRLQTLASNARKCFSMLAAAVKVNENIDNEIKICGLLRLLERIETGDFQMMNNNEQVNVEEKMRSQVLKAFINIYDLCQKEAKSCKRRITEKEIKLIKSFVIKHRVGLLSKTNIVASYISRGIIQTEEQLKAAVTFLMRCQAHDINIKEFEEYCKLAK